MRSAPEMTDFGKQLRNLRVRVGMTQADLARASNLGQSTISALETGRQEPWPSTRRSLARALRMGLEDFDAAIAGQEVRASPRLGPGRWSSGSAPARDETAAPTKSLDYASGKVLELLSDLGRAEDQLRQYRAAIDNICAACWTTDATLHVTGAFGPLVAEQRNRHGNFVGRHVSDFFVTGQEAGPDFRPVVMQQRAVDGEPVTFAWLLAGRQYVVYINPLRDNGGPVVGTVGVAIDVTERAAALDGDQFPTASGE